MTFQELLQASLDSGELLSIVDSSFSASDIVRSLGHSINGRRVAQARTFLVDNDVDISHWTKNGKILKTVTKNCPVCQKLFTKAKYEESVTCGYSCSNTYFRSGVNNPNWKENPEVSYRVKALKHYGKFCNRCGYSEEPALVVHHKDSNRQNNTLANLEVLCCNCHAKEHYS